MWRCLFSYEEPSAPSLSGTEGVSDRGTEAEHVARVELGVVHDVVVVGLRADEEVPKEVVADIATEVQQEMIAVHEDGTISSVGRATNSELVVEDRSLAAHAAHKIGGHSAIAPWQARSKNSVEVIQHRAIFLIAVVEVSLRAGRHLGAEAETIAEDNLGVYAGIRSAPLGRRWVSQRCAVGFGGKQRAAADGNVNLLSARNSRKYDDRANRRERKEPSQSSPLLRDWCSETAYRTATGGHAKSSLPARRKTD